ALAWRFAREWETFAKGLPPVRSEKELSDEEKKTKTIILFCRPSRSALLREAGPTLECKLSDTEFEIAGQKAALGADRGVVLTRPSPWAAKKDRYLVVCTGLFYGEHAADNHKLDLVPDFIVFTPGKEGEGESPAVLAGYFDSDWKADASLVETFKPPVEAPAPVLPPVPPAPPPAETPAKETPPAEPSAKDTPPVPEDDSEQEK
ncbi:MAG: hypothetical protein ACYTGB_20705, partial [Planctomycetota bacterium]